MSLLEISSVKALGEPAIYRGEQRTRCGVLALLLPQPTQAHGGAQLQRSGLLPTGESERLVKGDFCPLHVRRSLP